MGKLTEASHQVSLSARLAELTREPDAAADQSEDDAQKCRQEQSSVDRSYPGIRARSERHQMPLVENMCQRHSASAKSEAY
jgi:hypothetical protein